MGHEFNFIMQTGNVLGTFNVWLREKTQVWGGKWEFGERQLDWTLKWQKKVWYWGV
jgi:hypothetical protein